MKFNNGYWLLREGITAHLAAETIDVQTSPSHVSVAALTRPHADRGSHLNTPTTVDEGGYGYVALHQGGRYLQR